MGKISIIIQREFNSRVKKKSFIITTMLMPVLMLALMAAPMILMRLKSEQKREIMVVDRSGFIADKMQGDDNLTFIPNHKSYEELRGEKQDAFGILVIGEDVKTNPSNVQLYTYEASTMDMESAITRQIRQIIEADKLQGYDIEDLEKIMADIKTSVSLQSFRIGDGEDKDKANSSGVAMGVAYVLGFLIYMFVVIYGNMVMQGVIEEKNSKVMEIMVSSVKPFELMMGKILGIASVAITQFLIWVVFLFIAGTIAISFFAGDIVQATGDMQAGMPAASMGGLDPQTIANIQMATDPMFLFSLIGGFLVFFIGGYLLYAAMFAAVGSAVDNAEDAGQLQLPITIPIILSFLILINVMKDPNSSLAMWSSMIPFTSPVIMMARIPYGVPLWQIITSLMILYTSFILMVLFAGKIYRVGIFMHGKKPSLKELLKWSKYKS